MSARIEDVTDRDRLELYDDGRRIGSLSYQRAQGILVLEHTEVSRDQEGHGHGGRLVEAALDLARAERRRVIVVCPFAKAWLQRHPDYADLDYTHGTAGSDEQ
ncbi:GNAT family N-acetyltransferase [uncultured Nocardioides sp.]|uniref:N-acetyltransferase domain-containing protein n=1 Tax=uncultured Nocardioides sp. TaxID=198441 RepID=A0A6J4PBK4_9ACTN|nr:GNAT family N-acetyltransferase [uncultured Nocardioides sp.]CAA9406392.1 MAG: hypothetical protein AVDCRST_MAG06-2558 [uncultured Nocardioides sp.]